MKISIIIPTLNEEKYISILLEHLQKCTSHKNHEILISDGGSTDNTLAFSANYNVTILHSPSKSRAQQMNYAAQFAEGEILYFIHADCLPPLTFIEDINKEINLGNDAGCYRYKFDSDKFLLKINAWFNRFGGLICRGGDQTLFIKKDVFNNLNGFCEKHIIMEDYDFVQRLRKKYSFKIIPKYAMVSARKYEQNNWFKVNFANAIALFLFMTGSASPQTIKNTYHSLIKHPKSQ